MSNQESISKTLLLMGPIGSGKGTQAKLLSEELGYKAFSSGAYYRAKIEEQTPVGDKIAEIIEAGHLMPSWVHSYVLEDVIFNLKKDEGIILDSVAKKPEEAELLHTIFDWLDREYVVLYFGISQEEVEKRLAKRFTEEGRGDDAPESIKVRFEEFEKHTKASMEFFRAKNVVIDINALQSKEDVYKEIITRLTR